MIDQSIHPSQNIIFLSAVRFIRVLYPTSYVRVVAIMATTTTTGGGTGAASSLNFVTELSTTCNDSDVHNANSSSSSAVYKRIIQKVQRATWKMRARESSRYCFVTVFFVVLLTSLIIIERTRSNSSAHECRFD